MHEELTTEPGFYYLYGKAEQPEEATRHPALTSADVGTLRTRGVEPWHQQHWDWKAAGNFVCGGAGTGLLLFVALASLRTGSSFPLAWLALAIVALGLFLVLLKIGRPLRAAYVLRQPQRSWMAREAWVAMVLFPIGALAAWYDTPALLVAAAIVGMLFLYSQAMILREAKGIPAWRISLVVPLIVTTGIAEGAGLLLAATGLLPALAPVANETALVVAMLAALRAWTWRTYLLGLRIEGAPVSAIAVLDRFRPWFFALGLVLPLALIALGFVVDEFRPASFALAGLVVCATGGALKFILVTRAGFNQGFALAHTPVRGSGVPGPAVKPGWSIT